MGNWRRSRSQRSRLTLTGAIPAARNMTGFAPRGTGFANRRRVATRRCLRGALHTSGRLQELIAERTKADRRGADPSTQGGGGDRPIFGPSSRKQAPAVCFREWSGSAEYYRAGSGELPWGQGGRRTGQPPGRHRDWRVRKAMLSRASSSNWSPSWAVPDWPRACWMSILAISVRLPGCRTASVRILAIHWKHYVGGRIFQATWRIGAGLSGGGRTAVLSASAAANIRRHSQCARHGT